MKKITWVIWAIALFCGVFDESNICQRNFPHALHQMKFTSLRAGGNNQVIGK